MNKRILSSPKDVFMHILLVVTLYMSVVSFISLLFAYVDIALPDPLQRTLHGPFNTLRWSSSMLLVAFPVFLWLSWLIEKEFRARPEKRDLPVRKWLLYFTLFIAAVVIIIDLIVLFYNFYGGDLTSRFILKIGIVLAVTGAVFGFYLWDLRRQSAASKVPEWFAWGSSTVVIASLVVGFFIGGSPAHQRQIRFDEQRIQDLQGIQGQIVFFWSQKNELPEHLDDLQDAIRGFSVPRDPSTNEAYEYAVLNTLTFELCATFATEGGYDGRVSFDRPVDPDLDVLVDDLYHENWHHGSGRVCFERIIDPDLHRSD